MQSDDILNFKQNMSELEELILQAKKVPLSAMCMVDKDRMSRILEALTKEMRFSLSARAWWTTRCPF